MLMSTLPTLPGQTFEVRGLVVAQAVLPSSRRGDETREMVQSLAGQAAALGANAIIDVRTVLGGGGYSVYCVMTGTAVLVR